MNVTFIILMTSQVLFLLWRLDIKSNECLKSNFHTLVIGKDSHHFATIKTSQGMYSKIPRQMTQKTDLQKHQRKYLF